MAWCWQWDGLDWKEGGLDWTLTLQIEKYFFIPSPFVQFYWKKCHYQKNISQTHFWISTAIQRRSTFPPLFTIWFDPNTFFNFLQAMMRRKWNAFDHLSFNARIEKKVKHCEWTWHQSGTQKTNISLQTPSRAPRHLLSWKINVMKRE